MYITHCLDVLHEQPLALMANIAHAIGGLTYLTRTTRQDALLFQALDLLNRMPEHERCLSALMLAEVLTEYGSVQLPHR
ncbi:MAG: hypothetical protein ACYDBB_10465 [Armatimonadota bacterium]